MQVIKGFMGQTTAFKNQHIKTDVLIMGETKASNEARYIHGKLGNGTWTFYGGMTLKIISTKWVIQKLTYPYTLILQVIALS